MNWIRVAAMGIAGVVAFGASAVNAQEKIVVSIWGGNWKDGADQAIASEFTKRTGIKVEFITGGTMDRLTKAKVNKDRPESDITMTTSHVGYLYLADGLFEKLDMNKLPNAKDVYPVAIRSPYHIALYSYVYTPAFRTDLMPKDFAINSWSDLWNANLKGKLGLPDFDPSHIIVASAILSGGDAKNWKVGIPKLQQLKPNIKAFYQSDATSQELIKTGETPVQVLLSINAYHQMSQKIPLKIQIPKEGGVVGLDAIAINKGTKNLDAAHKFVDIAMDPSVQAKLCATYKCSPTNKHVKLDASLAGLPGIFTTPDQWSKGAIFIDDETRAKNLPEWRAWFTENMTR